VSTPEYRYIVVETYYNFGEPSSERIRARPIKGQDPFLPKMKVRCATAMREGDRIGSKFIIKGHLTARLGGTPFVSTSAHWEWYPVSNLDAERFIKGETVHVNGVPLTRRMSCGSSRR